MREILFHHNTPIEVQQSLIQALIHGVRIRLVYGDILTGKSYLTDKLVEGLVLYHPWDEGRDKNRLIIQYRQGAYGAPILDNLIVRIVKTKGKGGRIWYQHPTYQPFTDWSKCRVFWDGWDFRIRVENAITLNGKFRSRLIAERWLAKMKKWEM